MPMKSGFTFIPNAPAWPSCWGILHRSTGITRRCALVGRYAMSPPTSFRPPKPAPATSSERWRGRGNFNRALYLEGLRLGARSPEDILAAFDRCRDSRHHPVGTSRWEPLVDVLVHTQDIALPLGLGHTMPLSAARAAADRVWSVPFPFFARRRLRRFRLTADDVDWSAGSGPDVRGPISALLLLLTGRDASLSQLEGDGVTLLPHR